MRVKKERLEGKKEFNGCEISRLAKKTVTNFANQIWNFVIRNMRNEGFAGSQKLKSERGHAYFRITHKYRFMAWNQKRKKYKR